MPGDLMFNVMNSIHRGILKLSGGRLGWQASNMPVLELTTIGRKSGEPRSVMLTAPLIEGGNIVIVASRGGDDQNPAWFLNLRDHPAVEVAMKGASRTPMIASIANAQDRARMWPLITEKHTNYSGYQKKTDREIPLVVLSPA